MKLIIQKVLESNVKVDGQIVGEIKRGYMVLVGFTQNDTVDIIDKMIEKMIHLRIFEDEAGKMNLSLLDVSGQVLSISQFTLYANCKKGRRPSFVQAANGEIAKPLYDYFNEGVRGKGIYVGTGIFGGDMKVSLINDGPVTIVLDSDEIF